MCKKANKSLNFVRQNLSKCHQDVKISAHFTIVQLLLEYAACIWGPYKEYLIYEIEKIWRWIARWSFSDYNHYSSVAEMLKSPRWPTLESWRYICRLTQLYKIVISSYPCDTPTAILSANTISNKTPPPASLHITISIHYCPPAKLFPKIINQWNSLPNDIIESNSIEHYILQMR